MRTLVCLFAILLFGFRAFGAEAPVSGSLAVGLTSNLPNPYCNGQPAPYGWEPGYTDDVEDEGDGDPKEMILMQKPAFLNKPPLHDQIFNNQLSSEFMFRYQQQFGYTEAEQDYFLTAQQGYYVSPFGLTATQDDVHRRAFGQYMIERLVEFHTENMMKNDPALKRVYDIKQQVSNMKMNMGPSTHIDMTYTMAGNYLTTKVTNPFITGFVTINMDPGSMIPTSPTEVLLMAQKQIGRTYGSTLSYTMYDRALGFVLSKTLGPAMSANVSETVHLSGMAIDGTREGLSMLGFSLVF